MFLAVGRTIIKLTVDGAIQAKNIGKIDKNKDISSFLVFLVSRLQLNKRRGLICLINPRRKGGAS